MIQTFHVVNKHVIRYHYTSFIFRPKGFIFQVTCINRERPKTVKISMAFVIYFRVALKRLLTIEVNPQIGCYTRIATHPDNFYISFLNLF